MNVKPEPSAKLGGSLAWIVAVLGDRVRPSYNLVVEALIDSGMSPPVAANIAVRGGKPVRSHLVFTFSVLVIFLNAFVANVPQNQDVALVEMSFLVCRKRYFYALA